MGSKFILYYCVPVAQLGEPGNRDHDKQFFISSCNILLDYEL